MFRLRALLRACPPLPRADEQRLRGLLREIAQTPPGDDVLPARLGKSLMSAYEALQPPGRLGFLSILARQDVDLSTVRRSCQNLLAAEDDCRAAASLRARGALREALEPPSERIIGRLAQQPGGLRFLVAMRADLLSALAQRGPFAEAAPPSPSLSPPAAGSSAATAAAATAAAAAAEAGSVASPLAAEGGEAGEGERGEGLRERWRALDGSLRRLLSTWFAHGLLEPRMRLPEISRDQPRLGSTRACSSWSLSRGKPRPPGCLGA